MVGESKSISVKRDNWQWLLPIVLLLPGVAIADPEDPWEGGQWGPVIDWPHIAVSAANLPDGRILTWSGSERETWPTTEQTYSATWDPATGSFEEVFHPTHNMFCAHLAMMEDGRVFVNGGRNQTNSPWTSVFDYRNSEWVQIENMPSGGRWYPTTIALANGDMFTAIGTASQPRYPEVWNIDDGWQIKNGVDFNAMVLDDYFSSGTHGESRWWPLLHVAPNGQVFHSGPTPKMHYIDPTGNGTYTQVGGEFTDFYHKHGTSIMYGEGKILNAGGWLAGNNIASTSQAFTVDLNGPSPVVQATANMNHARKFHNGVMLPNGEVLVIGGNTSGRKFSDDGAILSVEIWSPDTGTWRLGASMATPRNYHSIALLTTDGRVLAAGSGYCSGNAFCGGSSHKDAEVYSPAYLFDNSGNPVPRPTITTAPPRVSSGQAFVVEATPGLDRFTMIKMSSTTHGMNTDVRFVEVSFTEISAGQYQLQAHANPNVLTAGYWMLFGLNANGVPSTAHVVQANTSGMPWINPIQSQGSAIGDSVNIPILVGDADDDPLTLSAIGLPAGVTLDSSTRVISGTPLAVGTYNVDVTVTDNDEGSRTRSFEWVVFADGLGGIRRDKWSGVAGTAVANLTALATFPDEPTVSDVLSEFEIPVNTEENFGTRMHGYLNPTVTGEYRFYISSDDNGELWLSTDNEADNRQLIASVPSWSSSRQWNKFPEQQSVLISLQAGQSYFIEALQKEGGGGDNLAVAWTQPGTTTIDVIAGAYLSVSDQSVRAPEAAKLIAGSIEGVTESWQTVQLPQLYTDLVVVATPRYTETSEPLVTRIRNAAGDSFEIRTQTASSSGQGTPVTVDFLALEAGTYDGAAGRFEARKYISTRTDENNAWVGEQRGYGQTYAAPVVLGQVMSASDSGFSVFWASDGVATNPPASASLYTGLHVAEDPVANRSAETIGYVVFEAGTATIGDMTYVAGLGADTVLGMTNTPPFTYAVGIDANHAVLSAAGMDGNNGGWPVLYGADAVDAGSINLVFDEDTLGDSERAHTSEQVAYVAFDVPVDVPLTVDPVTPEPEQTGDMVTFSVVANGGDGLLYNWNFGDGSPDTGYTPNAAVAHNYAAPGRYVVTVTVRDPNTGEEQTQTFIQLIHRPIVAGQSQASTPIVSVPDDTQVWVVNPDNNSVSLIDPVALTTLAEIPVAEQPIALQYNSDGELWVVSKKAAAVSIVDPIGRQVVGTISLPANSQPHGIVFSPANGNAFVALEALGEVIQIDLGSGQQVGSVYVGARPRHVSMTADAAKLLVSRFITNPLPGESTTAPVVESGGTYFGAEVLVVDPVGMSVQDTIVLQHSDRGVSEHTGPGIPNYLGPAVVSPDMSAAWVPSKQDNILAGQQRGGQGMTFDQTVRAITSKIHLDSGLEEFWARIDHDNASVGSHAAFGPYGAYLFTALEGNREIVVSDAYTATELLRFDTDRAPQGLSVSADGARLYAHNFMERSVTAYDITALIGSNILDVVELASIPTVAAESLSAEVLRGKQLFYDARDPRLALDSYMSCASCHNDAGQDGRVWDMTRVGTATANGEGLRNTISLKGRAALVHGFLHWSANFDEVQDFEGQIRTFAGGTGLMADADFFAGTRADPLGDPKSGLSTDLDALSAYLESLTEFEHSPHRNADGTISSQAEQGRLLFADKQCVDCHTPSRFTDSSVGNVHDIGTIKASSGNRLGGPLTGIDTPTLISVWNTAPYLHDGSALDLTEAISAHDGIVVSVSELDALAAYLVELDEVTAAIVDEPGCDSCVDLSSLNLVPYSNQDIAGDFALEDGGQVLYLENNTWKRTAQQYEITPTTIVTFEFQSTAIGEIHALGFDSDNNHSADRIFQVYGTQNWGVRDFDYTGSGWQSFQIPVGQYFTGSAMYLTFVNDHDTGSGNTSRFRNVQIVQSTQNFDPVINDPGTIQVSAGLPVSRSVTASDLNDDVLIFAATGLPVGLIMSGAGDISGTTAELGTYSVTVTVDDGNGGADSATFDLIVTEPGDCSGCIDFAVAGLESYGGQDIAGTYALETPTTGVTLTQNTWKRTLSTYTVTANTVIEFEFESTEEGEIHGVGLDADNTLSSDRIFKVHGSQSWGIQDFDDFGGGTKTYVIPVGQYYTGASMRLVLVNDRDSGSGNDSTFRNVRIYDTP